MNSYKRDSDEYTYFSRLSRDERCKVKYVCMDMFQLYKDVAEVYFPNAKICIDSFHVVKTETAIEILNVLRPGLYTL